MKREQAQLRDTAAARHIQEMIAAGGGHECASDCPTDVTTEAPPLNLGQQIAAQSHLPPDLERRANEIAARSTPAETLDVRTVERVMDFIIDLHDCRDADMGVPCAHHARERKQAIDVAYEYARFRSPESDR
jgi:hypothetical protein